MARGRRLLGQLVLVLVMTWYATYHLARTEAAQPLPFAFGGEANATDYARAIADGALLAVMATLGLLQLGHETTPELVQLTGASLFLYALAAGPFRKGRSRAAALLALPTAGALPGPASAGETGLRPAHEQRVRVHRHRSTGRSYRHRTYVRSYSYPPYSYGYYYHPPVVYAPPMVVVPPPVTPTSQFRSGKAAVPSRYTPA